MSASPGSSPSASEVEAAFLTLAGLVCTDHEADERGYLHYDTEYEGVIKDRASVAYRLLRELGLERPASPYEPPVDEGAFGWLAKENQRLRETLQSIGPDFPTHVIDPAKITWTESGPVMPIYGGHTEDCPACVLNRRIEEALGR